jgi:chaperonin cofactor prefoldin
MENNAHPSTIMFFLQLEKKNEVLDLKIKRLKNEIIKMDKEMEPLIDKYLEINIE